jgi:hypothetical protein
MKNGWRLVGLLLLASAWGLSETLGGSTLRLVAVALLLLAAARVLVNRPGTSTAMAGVAMAFKLVNAAPFFCHLAGIVLLGVAFDILATLLLGGDRLLRSDRKTLFLGAVTGATTAYLSCFLFAASMTWLFKYKYWAGGGFDRVTEQTLRSGSVQALAALVVVPAGLWIGSLAARKASRHSRRTLWATAAASLLLWVLGPFAH